jgi:hypothetical protein
MELLVEGGLREDATGEELAPIVDGDMEAIELLQVSLLDWS